MESIDKFVESNVVHKFSTAPRKYIDSILFVDTSSSILKLHEIEKLNQENGKTEGSIDFDDRNTLISLPQANLDKASEIMNPGDNLRDPLYINYIIQSIMTNKIASNCYGLDGYELSGIFGDEINQYLTEKKELFKTAKERVGFRILNYVMKEMNKVSYKKSIINYNMSDYIVKQQQELSEINPMIRLDLYRNRIPFFETNGTRDKTITSIGFIELTEIFKGLMDYCSKEEKYLIMHETTRQS